MAKFIKLLLTLFLVGISFGSPGQARNATFPFRTNEWIRTWLLCGPFPLQPYSETQTGMGHLPGFETDFLAAHGGETNPNVRVGQVETFDGGSAKWFRYTSKDSIINLDNAISKRAFVAAYGYTEIIAPEDRVCLLALGTNDGCRVWLNGEQIWDQPAARSLRIDDDLFVVKLHKGRNTLLLKVEEHGGTWAFCARFLPFDVEKFVDQTRLFKIINTRSGQAILLFAQLESMAGEILQKARLELVAQEDQDDIVWSADWNRKKRMLIAPEIKEYGRYVLRIRGVLGDGQSWSTAFPMALGKRNEYVLFDNGKTDYSIVIGEDASASEQWAAEELQRWLGKVSGVEFPVRFDKGKAGEREIIIGFNRHAQQLLAPDVRQPDDGDESFTYKNIGSNIVIWGGKQRGTMYGVMTFLERELGCRWYTPNVSLAPPRSKFIFDYLYHSEKPSIRVRNDFYYEAFNPIWAARNKINGAMNYRQQPGGVEGYWSVHTFYRFMPPSEFFDAHPEYYSLIDGERIWDHAQLCLTNPDVLDIVTERLKETIRKNPQYLIYSVSQNDWRNPCQCDQCQAIAQKEGSESGPIIWFVNQVAERIEKEFPDKYVGTLAYQYTRKPCKNLRPRHNVVVRLCSIECCFAHPFESCPENVSFMEDLNGWAAIAPHLYIWDYVTNFSHYIMPYPNFKVLQPNIKTLRDHKAIGIMEQGAYQSRGGEFAELRMYVLAKLLWNPECDVDQVINDFMYGYYGRAGQYVRQYFNLLHNRITPDTHIHLGMKPEDNLFSDVFIRQAEEIFDAAEAVADNEEILHRVEMARLPIMYLKCLRNPSEAKYDGTYQRFNRIVEREGITHYAEAGARHRKAFHQKMKIAE